MILYILYRIGHMLALAFPVKTSYRMAAAIADIYSSISRKDREAVEANLKIIFGESLSDEKAREMAKEVFRNFAKYLVDFFNFSNVNEEYLKRFVKIEGIANLNAALQRGKGVILLSAHIGNWELGAAIVALLGYPMNAVTLRHANERINSFFIRQRLIGKVHPIEVGSFLRACYAVLKNNGLLALLGDRDFTKNGLYLDFFGIRKLIPKGPAALSCRTGSMIIPTFMLREPDDTFKLVFDKPISADTDDDEAAGVMVLTRRCTSVLEGYIRRYPTQWYVFRVIGTE